MITNIHFKNFKAFEDFSIAIKDFNVLTGPNNSGKSTILDGLRVLQGVYRFASRYNPQYIHLPNGISTFGYEIPDSSVPIILENIQTNFDTDSPSTIKYKFLDGQSLTILFDSDHPSYLYFDTPRKPPRTATTFKNEFPVNISVIPTLGPFEINEEIVDKDYVQRWYGSRRSARLFRNYWYHNPDNFQIFKDAVETSWKGMSVSPPQRRSMLSKELIMFCEENRFPREICWAGFGFQIWLQLLTHILNAKDGDLIVVDEPEIYLHPDLQHKILILLRKINARILLATHSVEIINNVEPSEVLLIEKRNRWAKRISDLEGLQTVSNLLGSGQNIQLTRLARGKKILFVEGQDVKLLAKLAKVCKKEELFTSGEITTIQIEGFSNHERIIHTNWAFSRILGEDIKISVLLDRDYRTDEEIQTVADKLNKEVNFAHILIKKEIENFFIVPTAIEKAISQKIKERTAHNQQIISPPLDIDKILQKVTEGLKLNTLSQLIGHKIKIQQKKGLDPATITRDTTIEFENNWKNLAYRFRVISGKMFFSVLNDYLQSNYKISITCRHVGNYISEKEVDDDLRTFFTKLENFKNGSVEINLTPRSK